MRRLGPPQALITNVPASMPNTNSRHHVAQYFRGRHLQYQRSDQWDEKLENRLEKANTISRPNRPARAGDIFPAEGRFFQQRAALCLPGSRDRRSRDAHQQQGEDCKQEGDKIDQQHTLQARS